MARKSIEDDAEWKRLSKAEEDAWADWAVGSAEEAEEEAAWGLYVDARVACEAYEREWKP